MKAMCMTCGKVFEGATRALTNAQFTLHNLEKHKRKLNEGQVLKLRFFKGEPPKVERAKKVRSGEVSEYAKRRASVVPKMAVWI